MIFEELDYQQTAIGAVSLRRRSEPRLDDRLVYEVKLDEEFLMSSLFTEGEEALARLGLAALPEAVQAAAVVVGGLGLGYTAATALADARLGELLVVDALQPVIDWHRAALLPCSRTLTDDPRCRFECGDFFALAASDTGFDARAPGRRFDAVLLDIDHSPRHWLAPSSAAFYGESGLGRLRGHLHEHGVFALWSNDAEDAGFVDRLRAVFGAASAHRVAFDNPYTGAESANTVYVATCRGGARCGEPWP